jgi:O-methyltransferase
MAGHYDSSLDMPVEQIFPFDYLPDGSTLVDIGGGNGQNAIRLAVSYPRLSAVVQDHRSIVSVAEKALKEKFDRQLTDRITWEAHDYYSPQSQKGAAVYLLSHVLMDNSDEYGFSTTPPSPLSPPFAFTVQFWFGLERYHQANATLIGFLFFLIEIVSR